MSNDNINKLMITDFLEKKKQPYCFHAQHFEISTDLNESFRQCS